MKKYEAVKKTSLGNRPVAKGAKGNKPTINKKDAKGNRC